MNNKNNQRIGAKLLDFEVVKLYKSETNNSETLSIDIGP